MTEAELDRLRRQLPALTQKLVAALRAIVVDLDRPQARKALGRLLSAERGRAVLSEADAYLRAGIRSFARDCAGDSEERVIPEERVRVTEAQA